MKEINEAVSYVQGRLKNAQGLEKFRNIQSVFSSMDDNGDGTVDFQEFTNAMTGSSESALDTTSEHDIEKLYRCFVDFGVLKLRKHAVDRLAEYTGYTINLGTRKLARGQPSSKLVRPKTANETFLPHEVLGTRAPGQDVDCYSLFKTLFGNEESTFITPGDSAAETLANKEAELLRIATAEKILDEFMESSRPQDLPAEEQEKEEAYRRLQEKLKESRKNELLVSVLVHNSPTDVIICVQKQSSDPDAVALQQRLLEERQQKALSQKMRAGTVRPTTAGGIRKSTVAPITLIPIDANTRQDQATRLSAKKDAYGILKACRSNGVEIHRRGGALHLDDDHCSMGSKLSFHSRSADSLHSAASRNSQQSLTSLRSGARSSAGNSLHPLPQLSKSEVLSTAPKAMRSILSKSFSAAAV